MKLHDAHLAQSLALHSACTIIPSNLRRLSAKSCKLALRSATGLRCDYRLRLGTGQTGFVSALGLHDNSDSTTFFTPLWLRPKRASPQHSPNVVRLCIRLAPFFAVNLGHIRNGGKGKEVVTFSIPLRPSATSPNLGEDGGDVFWGGWCGDMGRGILGSGAARMYERWYGRRRR